MATSIGQQLSGSSHDPDVTRQHVENAESRARLQAKLSRGNDRQYARALHRQADDLCQRGEYESALVLYHRAANLYPHDSSHNVAARRTAVTISSWNNPEKSSARFPMSTWDNKISRVTLGAESATLKTRDASKSPADLPIIPDILRFFDVRKKRTSHKTSSALGLSTTRLARSRTILRQVNNRASVVLKTLRASFNNGQMKTSLRLAEDLLALSSCLEDPNRYKIPAYHYLSLIHAALGRHDRACGDVARLVRLSRRANDVVLFSRSLVTLGKVHLSFGHLDAAARAWENLSIHVEHPAPRAWLHHEIGRCHLETGKYVEALRKAEQCRQCAEQTDSKKWTFHAGLLRAQCLAMLGRFAEALEQLRVTAKISEEEGDTPTLSYIRDLIEELNRALREVTFGADRCSRDTLRRLSPRNEGPGPSEGNEAITTLGIRRTTHDKGDDVLTSPFYSDYLENEIPDREISNLHSNSLDSPMSCVSKGTNLTYVIESRTDVSCRSKLDGMRICDDELTELLSCESYTTFATCCKDSSHFIDDEKISAPLKQPIEACCNNVETSGGLTVCETFRISRSCEDGRRNFDTTTDRTLCDVIARTSRHWSFSGTRKQDNEDESSVRETFSGF